RTSSADAPRTALSELKFVLKLELGTIFQTGAQVGVALGVPRGWSPAGAGAPSPGPVCALAERDTTQDATSNSPTATSAPDAMQRCIRRFGRAIMADMYLLRKRR